MFLTPGARLGHFEIVAPLGAGGMGEVYRAVDTRLRRTVAIKVISDGWRNRDDLRARFTVEAEAIAALAHPNICQLFDVGHEDGIDFLVMELVNGESLAARLARGPLVVDRVAAHATAMAAALGHAHRHGIVHRDVKPSNVILTDAGLKLLDFGLARIAESPALAECGKSTVVATREPLTAVGDTLGTWLYMAPEQLRGERADARTDVFALGAVIYEMLTGRRAFDYPTHLALVTAILTADPPDVRVANPDVPLALAEILRTCLAKDPDDRWHDARDLERALRAVHMSPPAALPTVRRSRQWRVVAALVLCGVSLYAGAMIWRGVGRDDMRVSEPVTRLSVVLTGDRPYLGWLALTPDGRTLVYRVGREGSNQLVARSMDRLEATPLDGTGGGFDPFFSPDGRWMGFVGNRRLRKIRLAGGGYEELCELGVGMNGGTWGADGTIVFAPQDGPGLMRISADGGTPARLTTTPPNERAHRNPQFLPDAKGLLFTVTTTETASYDQARIEVLELATGARRVVLEGVRWARYVPPGHLVFARAGRLFATSFDPLRYQVIGDPVALAGDVSMEGFTVHAAVSDGGSLAYVPASLPPESTRRLVWINRKGEVEPVRNEPGYFLSPRVSPDGRRVAFIEQRPSNTLSVYDLDRATSTRVAATGDVISPAWLPDGRTLLYSRSQPQNDLASTAIDSSLDRSLFRSPDALEPESVSPDGRLVITTMISLTTRSDLWVVPLDSSDKPWALLQSPGEEYGARISPDGKWFAYASNEAGLGRHEVYVRPLARSGGRHQISTDGGNAVAWAASGRELFYRQRDRLMAVDIRLGSTFSAGPPKALFTLSGRYREGFDVSPDGQRFLFVQEIEKPVAQVNIVLNWPGDLPHHPPAKWQIECAPI